MAMVIVETWARDGGLSGFECSPGGGDKAGLKVDSVPVGAVEVMAVMVLKANYIDGGCRL